MKKSKKVAVMVISSILIILLAFLGVYFLWPWNAQFFEKSNKEFVIPGLDTNFVPQGMSCIDGTNLYIISGYMSDGSPSRYYVIDSKTNVYQYFTLRIQDKDYTGHAGGVEVEGNKVWTVSGDDGGHCYCFELTDVLESSNGDKIDVKSMYETNNGADFVFADAGILWVGEFYRAGNYDTDETHHIKTTSNEENKAIVFGYTIDQSSINGVDSIVPVKALSIRGLCQGIAVTDEGKFIMSTSYSIPDSKIYTYENVLTRDNDSTIIVEGSEVPLWFLDNNSLIKEINVPSMAEEVVVKDGKVYILFESACQKYKLVNRKKLTNVYSLPISEIV